MLRSPMWAGVLNGWDYGFSHRYRTSCGAGCLVGTYATRTVASPHPVEAIAGRSPAARVARQGERQGSAALY